MQVCDTDIEAMAEFFSAIQIYQDNQIVTKDMSVQSSLKDSGSRHTVEFLEAIMGKDGVSNGRVQKVLHMIHPYMVSASKSGLGAAGA